MPRLRGAGGYGVNRCSEVEDGRNITLSLGDKPGMLGYSKPLDLHRTLVGSKTGGSMIASRKFLIESTSNYEAWVTGLQPLGCASEHGVSSIIDKM